VVVEGAGDDVLEPVAVEVADGPCGPHVSAVEGARRSAPDDGPVSAVEHRDRIVPRADDDLVNAVSGDVVEGVHRLSVGENLCARPHGETSRAVDTADGAAVQGPQHGQGLVHAIAGDVFLDAAGVDADPRGVGPEHVTVGVRGAAVQAHHLVSGVAEGRDHVVLAVTVDIAHVPHRVGDVVPVVLPDHRRLQPAARRPVDHVHGVVVGSGAEGDLVDVVTVDVVELTQGVDPARVVGEVGVQLPDGGAVQGVEVVGRATATGSPGEEVLVAVVIRIRRRDDALVAPEVAARGAVRRLQAPHDSGRA